MRHNPWCNEDAGQMYANVVLQALSFATELGLHKIWRGLCYSICWSKPIWMLPSLIWCLCRWYLMVCKIVVLYNSCICNHASHVLAKDAFLRGCVETWVEESSFLVATLQKDKILINKFSIFFFFFGKYKVSNLRKK